MLSLGKVLQTDNAKFARRLTTCVFAIVFCVVLSLALPDHDLSAVLSFFAAVVSTLTLFVFGMLKKGRQRLAALLVVLIYVATAILVMRNYSLVRDHVRWLLMSGSYKSQVLAQFSGEELKHTEWDFWGFAGVANTATFLVFDPTDSLAGAADAAPPIKARGLPCEVFRVRRLDQQWYAVLLYTDTYWGQGACK
jgi:hypothetical protein